MAVPGIPAGGTTSQVLTKTSATDYAVNWQTPSAGGGSGDVVGPASATDNAIARFSTTTGKLLKDNPNFTLTDTGILALKVGANTVMGHDPTNQNGTFSHSGAAAARANTLRSRRATAPTAR